MLLLKWPPPISGVLVLYMVLTLAVVSIFLMGGERHAFATLGTSGLVWAISQITSDFMAPLTHHWYFNPFAWQFLFSIGMFFGMKWDFTQPALRLLGRFSWLVPAAWAIVVMAFLYRLLLGLSYFGFDVTPIRITDPRLAHMKDNLSAVRLLHFLSVALLVVTYFRPTSTILRWTILLPVIVSGMYSLELFSLSVVLSTLDTIAVLAYQPPLLIRLAMDSVACFLMVLTAFVLLRGRMTARINRQFEEDWGKPKWR